MTFFEELKSGKATHEDLYARIDKWTDSDEDIGPLHEFLGFNNQKEYETWTRSPKPAWQLIDTMRVLTNPDTDDMDTINLILKEMTREINQTGQEEGDLDMEELPIFLYINELLQDTMDELRCKVTDYSKFIWRLCWMDS